MPRNYGSRTSRVLDPTNTQYLDVLWASDAPPLDSELVLIADLANDWQTKYVLRNTPSGWLSNEGNPTASFVTNPSWSNWFQFGRQKTGEKASVQWAVVNGWLVPVTSTRTGLPPGSPNNVDTWNRIALPEPPTSSGDLRNDFVFLEVWLARISSNPSTLNKPSASSVYRHGNVESGSTAIADDLQDPEIGAPTSERLQVQYRIRVQKGLIGLASYPDGFDPSVKAQGAAGSPTNFVFQNMRQELGDPGLWRAGDGTANALGTVDGYVYAIPLSVVFRRNSVAWAGEPQPNHNGAFNRNPTAVSRDNWKTFTTVPTLAADLTDSAMSLTLVSAVDIPLPATSPNGTTLIRVGDELMTYTSIVGTTVNLAARGVNGTRAEQHAAGSTVQPVSGRPDGLFADQIAKTDILDLRHIVNPNGFDYDAILRANVDKLLRGELRSNWKRSGGGSQGTFVFYQDKISGSNATGMGVTKLDAPDGFRQVFSDAAVQQTVTAIVRPHTAPVVGGNQLISTAWTLSSAVNAIDQSVANQFTQGDVLEIPIAQFKTGLGTDTDQVRFLADGMNLSEIVVRVEGDAEPLVNGQDYTVAYDTGLAGPDANIRISFLGVGPGPGYALTRKNVYITFNLQYGPGRGLSRRPDAIHSVCMLSNTGGELMLQTAAETDGNIPLRIGYAPYWSRYRANAGTGALPVTAEAYGDLGSKTLVLAPFRNVNFPGNVQILDGSLVNGVLSTPITAGNGTTPGGSTTFTCTTGSLASVHAGDILQITPDPLLPPENYYITTVNAGNVVTSTNVTAFTGAYAIYPAQGLMPKGDLTGQAKWATTDPLELFAGSTVLDEAQRNLYVLMPRNMMPGWGEFRLPILHQDGTTFHEGVNFGFLAKKSNDALNSDYIAAAMSGPTYNTLATHNLLALSQSNVQAATYNAKDTYNGVGYAGLRFFTDARGLGRQGLELPPFYGIARLFAVYSAEDYILNGSRYNSTTRERIAEPNTHAKNLLRQNFEGPLFWVEKDVDGDSTFILNADALDLTKSTNFPIAAFSSGQYVIEATLFGFDRGAFDTTQPFRLVLNRNRSNSNVAGDYNPDRINNLTTPLPTGPSTVLPAPIQASDVAVVNYSRTPYQGDAFGTQTSYADIPYVPGPITSADAYAVSSTPLVQSTSNWQTKYPKQLEVLASLSFSTSLGTGRLSFNPVEADLLDLLNVGFEDPQSSTFPPPTFNTARPTTAPGAVYPTHDTPTGTAYLGCIERLPLGSFCRDKDFRGTVFTGDTVHRAPLIFHGASDEVAFRTSGFALTRTAEHTEAALYTADTPSGQPGDVLVHVDGNTVNYSLTNNFRTLRGGSLFSAAGTHPGGEFSSAQGYFYDAAEKGNALACKALLVRNTVLGNGNLTSGDELMLLIVTTACRITGGPGHTAVVTIGTNGVSEGWSSADLYRVEGRPLTVDHSGNEVDLNTITLARRGS